MAGKQSKNKKYGRNSSSAQNAAYIATNRRMKNKKRKLIRHLTAYPEDAQAVASLAKIERGQIGVKPRRTWKWCTKPSKVKGGEPFRYRERLAS